MSHKHPVLPEDLDEQSGEFVCETCEGCGEIDVRLGGYDFNGWVKCPDCDGKGFWKKVTP